MSSKEILAYFDATECKETRSDLKLAVGLVNGPRVAIDCGCGAGSDIVYLRENGFTVHAFDIEESSIARCLKRFVGDSAVILSRSDFSSFAYPTADLVVADASLFFCPENQFGAVWQKIKNALLPGGVFVGSFLGPEDTMAGADYDRKAFWPEVMIATEEQVKVWFDGFAIISFTEHRSSGVTASGAPHDWHIFSVVAQKPATIT